MWVFIAAQALASATPTLAEEITVIDRNSCTYENPCKGSAQGVDYEILSDKRVDFDAKTSWLVEIVVDEFTDSKSCILRSDRGVMGIWLPEILFALEDADATILHVGEETYPRTNMLFRVDSHAAIVKREDLAMPRAQGMRLLEQMKRGNELRLGYQTWPENYRETTIIDLTGFTAILNASFAFCLQY